MSGAENPDLIERWKTSASTEPDRRMRGQFGAIARLFAEHDTMTVLKWKDIISATENAIDRLEDVSDVVESVIVKNA